MRPGTDEKFILVDITDEMLEFIDRADNVCAHLSYDELKVARLHVNWLRKARTMTIEELAQRFFEEGVFPSDVAKEDDDYQILAETAILSFYPELVRFVDQAADRVVGLKVSPIGQKRRAYQAVFETIPASTPIM